MPQLAELIDDYQRFYKVSPDSERNLRFFSDFLSHPTQGVQFVAVDTQGAPIGFATLYFLPSSLNAKPYCLMNDLYSVPLWRGKGVGKALIAHCRSVAKQKGFSSIEWMTQDSNTTAQKLYDSLPAEKTKWFYYSLPTQ